jgi:hypothetical protein
LDRDCIVKPLGARQVANGDGLKVLLVSLFADDRLGMPWKRPQTLLEGLKAEDWRRSRQSHPLHNPFNAFRLFGVSRHLQKPGLPDGNYSSCVSSSAEVV